jgi:membrane-bound metal-dependent hydrolase YbcI (DUF457 family)
MFEEHRFASEFRVKIITGWCAIYAALAVAFVWANSNYPTSSWIILAAAVVVTILMWLADRRNRPAIRSPKNIGMAIEIDKTAAIPDEQRFFSSLEKGISHSLIIDVLSIVLLIIFVLAAWYLWKHNGVIPGKVISVLPKT